MRNLIDLIEAMLGMGLPMDDTPSREASRLSDDDLMEMANLGPSRTGLRQGVIFISTKMGQHGPRVKYMLKPGGPSFSMTISDDPQIVANSLPAKAMRTGEGPVRQFVLANRESLLRFWNHGIEMMDEEVEAMKNNFVKIV